MRARYISILFILFLGNSALSQTFNNLIITEMNPDPGICRVGDDYYLITSTFESYFPALERKNKIPYLINES